VLIRGVTVPILLNQLKATYKLNVLRPQLEELRQEMSTKSSEPEAMAEGQRRMQLLFKEHGVTPFTPLKGLIIQGPIFISFFFAIRNMAEKVPSFKTGGTLWFTDLTTADTTYILPLLTAVTFLIMVESNMQEGLEGNPVAGTMKKFSRIIAFLSIPILIGIENALFCYWLTSNLFTLGYGLAIRRPDVRKLLNLPDVIISSTTKSSTSPSSPLPFSFPQPKDQNVTQEDPPMSTSESSSSVPDRRISRSSVLSQRIRTLERQLKDRKNKK
jgi:YidC/Oxa1 family membrane protein insertase